MAFCKQCGGRLDGGIKYCPACGKEVGGAVPTSVQMSGRDSGLTAASPRWVFAAIYALLAATMLFPWVEVGFFLGTNAYSLPMLGARLWSLVDSAGAYLDEGTGVVFAVTVFAIVVAWAVVFALLMKGIYDIVKRPGQSPEKPVTFLIALASMTGLVCLMLGASGQDLGLGQSGLISVGASPWLWASLGLSVLALFVIELLPSEK